MEMQLASTPFGSRRMTAALLSVQKQAQQIPESLAVDKWHVHRWLCEAKNSYDINDRSLAVLSALLSFYPESQLMADNSLIVFPSNKQLALRAHGMADATLRRHLAALIDAGFIARHDSPNGKRYARRTKDGELKIAFGFSLAPLLARSHELEAEAEKIRAEKASLREAREQLTLQRRDIAKLLELAFSENLAGDWNEINERFRDIVAMIPRRATSDELTALITTLHSLNSEIVKLLNNNKNIEILNANESQNERQLIESKPDSYFEKDRSQQLQSHTRIKDNQPTKPSISLEMVLRACPEICAYSSTPINQWPSFIQTAEKVRRFIGIDTKLYEFANKTLGRYNTAISIAYILQRYDHIRSAGGYLRILAEKATEQSFSIRPMILAALTQKNR